MAAPHDPLLLTKACRLQGDAKEWHAGILSVHASRIRWQPGASGSVPPREVPAGSLTTQKARGRALIRLVAPSGDICSFFPGSPGPLHNAKRFCSIYLHA